MAATVIEIADAVVAALNAANLSQSFTAERFYVPVHELKDLATLRVSVVPRELSLVSLSRRADDFDYVVDIGVQKSIGRGQMTAAQTNAASDPLMILMEEIVDMFRGQSLQGRGTALCVAAANAPVYAPIHIDELKVFTSVVTLTFREARDR